MMWTKATHDLIDQSVPILCWWIIAVFRPPAIINRMPERWRETFFGNKSPRRRLLLWGVGVFLLGCYAGPISGWLLGYWSDPVRFLSFLMVAAGLMLMLLWLLAFIWREVRGWGR